MTGGPGRDGRRGGEPEDLPELSIPEPAPAASGVHWAGALGDRYQLVTRLGAGAFGEVYQARDNVLGRDVAIKRVRLEAFADPAQQEEVKLRFLREAQVAARLRHPGIVTTHDIVVSGETSVIVMELVAGRTLESLLAERGRLSLAETTALLAQVASALDHAHSNEVVHRDIKPANIMIEPTGHVKVMDFGIAKAGGGGNLTASGLIMGTPNYMPPEQARGEQADARSDLFSLGCVLYECLTGVKPFGADTLTAILIKILTAEPPPVSFETTGLPRGIEAVLSRAMAKEPASRYASGAEMMMALQAAARGVPAPVAGGLPARATPAPVPPGDRTRLSPRPAAARRHARRRAVLLAGGVVALAAALAWVAVARTQRPAARPQRASALVVEEPRGVLDRLLGREPRLRITVPGGTSLKLALVDPLSSETAVAGSAVTAETANAVRIEGVEAVPPGSRLRGRVTHAVSAGQAGGRGELTLVFDALELDGGTVELRSRPLALRAPARKRKSRANDLPPGLSEIGGAVEGLIGRLKGTGGSVEGGAAETVTVAHAKGHEVTLPAQAALSIELADPLTVSRRQP